jgi:hypothetical protein
MSINLLAPKDSSIIKALSESYEEESKKCSLSHSVIALEFNKDSVGHECRIAFLNEKYFRIFPPKSLANAIGYFYFGENAVIVFSDELPMFFTQSEKTKIFSFLKSNNTKSERQEIERPSPSFEPDVWIYRFYNNEFILEKKGMFNFLGQ